MICADCKCEFVPYSAYLQGVGVVEIAKLPAYARRCATCLGELQVELSALTSKLLQV